MVKKSIVIIIIIIIIIIIMSIDSRDEGRITGKAAKPEAISIRSLVQK